jgi:endonuclease/exonuclease/phosphatase family metal-dependent hydrolase
MAVTTLQAPSRPRSGGRLPLSVAELALPALTVAFGLQLLRLMIPTLVSVYRDRLGAPLASLAMFALGTIALGLLAPVVARLLGRRGALVLAAAGVALVRLALQVIPDAGVRWLLAPAGVVLFLWFVALWLSRGGGGFGLALLVGLAVDTALQGLGGSWDYAWAITGWTVALAALLAAAALWALASLPDRGPQAGPPVAGLAGIGPALFLHALIWQNLGWQAVGGGGSQAQAFLWVMVANLGALVAGTAAARVREIGWPVVGAAVATLVSAAALGPRATLAACLVGQAAAAVLVVAVTRPPEGSGEPRRGAPVDREGSGEPPGLGAVAAAWTAGMLLFVLLLFGYYAAYDVVLPFDNRLVPPLAAALLGLAAAGSRRRARRPADRPPGPRDPLPVWTGVALLAAPVLFWASAPGPVLAAPDRGTGPAPPVRVMSYNLHFGFDVQGWSDLEAIARAIEASGAEVVGLQEVSRGWYINGSTDMLAWLQRRLRMPHTRFAGASDAIWGNAVLSRHPIVAGGVVDLPREGVPLRRNYLWVELDLGARRRLRVVVTHLHHVEGPDGDRVRQVQVRGLLEGAAGRPATVLLGDLNAEPGSAAIAGLRAAGLADAFVAAGGGPADELTWPADEPDRRIDYLWLSGDLTAGGFAATTTTASDHRGVTVTIRQVVPSS